MILRQCFSHVLSPLMSLIPLLKHYQSIVQPFDFSIVPKVKFLSKYHISFLIFVRVATINRITTVEGLNNKENFAISTEKVLLFSAQKKKKKEIKAPWMLAFRVPTSMEIKWFLSIVILKLRTVILVKHSGSIFALLNQNSKRDFRNTSWTHRPSKIIAFCLHIILKPFRSIFNSEFTFKPAWGAFTMRQGFQFLHWTHHSLIYMWIKMS